MGNALDVKRLMGMKYTDESVRKDRKHWPFRVIETNEGSAAVAVEYQGKAEQYSPEQISAMVRVSRGLFLFDLHRPA